MGDLIQIRCPGCGLDEQHCEGVGMAGVIYRACACPSCAAVVTLEQNLLRGDPEPPLLCPVCGGPVLPVVHGTAPEEDEPLGRSRHDSRIARAAELATETAPVGAGAGDTESTSAASAPRTPCPRCGGPLGVVVTGLWD